MGNHTKAGTGKKVIGFILKIVFIAILITTIILSFIGYRAVKQIISESPDIHSIDFSPKGFATYIYDSEGNQIQKLITADSNRTAVSIKQIPESMQHAVVAIEDERFYKHHGIDARGIIRAFINGLFHSMHFTQGGSTITQQLLKNNVFVNWTEEKTLKDRLTRKIQEQYLAIQLEKELNDKDLILENYLNTINLGAGTYGVEAASKKYFNKDVWNLSLSESAVIAAITKNPSRYNPISHPEWNEARKNTVLKKMKQLGYISDKEYEEARVDDVYQRINEAQKKHSSDSSVFSYFVDALTEQVISDLQKQKGYSEKDAYRMLYSGGLKIYTTQSKKIQDICDEEYKNPDNFPDNTEYAIDWALSVEHENGEQEHFSKEMMRNFFKKKDKNFTLSFKTEEEGRKAVEEYKKAIIKETDRVIAERCTFEPQPQSSLVVMDQSNGYVKAIIGGRGDKQASLTLDRATKVTRQPGSTFKIPVYAEALENGKNIGSLIDDSFYMYSNRTEVHNYDGKHRGLITIREAIKDSVNVVAVKLLTELTPEACFERIEKFGITTLTNQDISQPLALGGIYNGVTNMELTAAYAAIANKGIYTKPIFYTKILDRDDKIIIDNTAETHRVISEETAWILTDAMKDVIKKGTGTSAALKNKMPAAGKTGSTSDYRDLWFVGYTPYYTIGIWAGFDNHEKMEETYLEYHKILWGKIMTRLTNDKEVKDFEQPKTVKKMKICGISGKKPSKDCKHVINDYVAEENIPVEKCSVCGEKAEEYKLEEETEEDLAVDAEAEE